MQALPSTAHPLRQRLESEITQLREQESEFQKHMQARQKFMQQLHESDLVLTELKALDEEAVVYKLIGPVLVKQETEEARSNVEKRLSYIRNEVTRNEKLVQDISKQIGERRQRIGELEGKLRSEVAGKAAE